MNAFFSGRVEHMVLHRLPTEHFTVSVQNITGPSANMVKSKELFLYRAFN